ncbi:TPA: AlpA family phage regulatory protein [Aeromonas sobria]|jgi:prophage regulatory protein|nr:AlpA family phage regulatory protein [Aeromonas sobria]
MKSETCLLNLAEVIECCTVSRATIYRMMARGTFPRAVQPKGCRRVAWRSSDIQAWINSLQYTDKK